MKGYIHSTESFGSVDGPGVRFLIFLKGCDMRCRYCHNPDTWEKNCGEEVEAEELLKKALRYKTDWRKEGGITVSGGEALLQIDFLIDAGRDLASRDLLLQAVDETVGSDVDIARFRGYYQMRNVNMPIGSVETCRE